MTNESREYRRLWTSSEQVSTIEEARKLLSEVQATVSKGVFPSSSATATARNVFRSLMELTKTDVATAEQMILDEVIPRCLRERATSDIEDHIALEQLRKLLRNWLEQYSEEERLPLRQRILDALLVAAETQPEPALWTIATIGFRSWKIVRFLKRMGTREDHVGESALACLAALAPASEDRHWLVSKVIQRLSSSPSSSRFDFVIQESADPAFLPFLRIRLLENVADYDLGLSLLGRIADSRAADSELQRQVWALLSEIAATHPGQRQRTLFSGSIAPHCDIEDVTRSLLDRLTDEVNSRWLAYHRLEDCVRPKQLEGLWRPKGTTIETLHQNATQSTGAVSRAMTTEWRVKEMAWHLALAVGIPEASSWIDDALGNDDNPYVQQTVLEIAACLASPEIPKKVSILVEERADIARGSNDGRLLPRMAAAKLIGTSASPDALDLLLNCGFTIEGLPLQSVAAALGDVAASQARREHGPVVMKLLDACKSGTISQRRLLAVAGLERLAHDSEFSYIDAQEISLSVRDSSLTPYARARLIWCLGRSPEAQKVPGLLSDLLLWAQASETDNEIRLQSLEALIRFGVWKSNREVVYKGLGLAGEHASPVPLEPERYQPWQCWLLVHLLALEPETFSSAAIEIILKGDEECLHQLLVGLLVNRNSGQVPPESVVDAAISRTISIQRTWYGETEAFRVLARLAPQRFVDTDWESVWARWMPIVRSAFATAVAEVGEKVPRGSQARILKLLEALLSDSSYQTRRAAARSYSRIDRSLLQRLCENWARSGLSDLRRRAAEIAEWLPPDDEETLDHKLLRELRTDPEPLVREAAGRAYKSLRHRIWSNYCLQQIEKHRDGDGNEWVRRAYRYGRALTRIGDDTALERISAMLNASELPLNIAYWLQELGEEIEKSWRKVTQEWPDPWLPWSGELEEVEGVVSGGHQRVQARISLWHRRRSDPSDRAGWGGAIRVSGAFSGLGLALGSDSLQLEIPGRSTGEILVTSAGTEESVVFVGNGPYPVKIATSEHQ